MVGYVSASIRDLFLHVNISSHTQERFDGGQQVAVTLSSRMLTHILKQWFTKTELTRTICLLRRQQVDFLSFIFMYCFILICIPFFAYLCK